MGAGEFHHVSVLLDEAIEALAIRPGGTYVDVTAGGGGHSLAILERLGPGGVLVAMDRDPNAVAAARARLAAALAGKSSPAPRVEVIHGAWSVLGSTLEGLAIQEGSVDGLLADLGVSSHQLDAPERGFSFQQEGPLDMRMDTTQAVRACDLVNDLPERDLQSLLRELGDERDSRAVARAIVRRRGERRFETTMDLAEVISRAKGGRRGKRVHPATRAFQAIRMSLNQEQDELRVLLDSGLRWLCPGGRWAVISFHSGEDRAVKHHFRALAQGCDCPPAVPVCRCGKVPEARLLHRRGRSPSDAEVRANSRARSARLRVLERLTASTSLEGTTHGAH